MGFGRVLCFLIIFLCGTTSVSTGSGFSRIATTTTHEQAKFNFRGGRKDIMAPITTVPSTNPAVPILNPDSQPDSTAPATMGGPTITPAAGAATTASPPGASWCVASQSASSTALQVALDYACGYGGADCSGIQPAGSCYKPNTLRDHASYAFNSYYQKNPLPTSCNFGGTAVVTSTNPSTGTCQLPSTSTSSSILNTTNSNGATIFGATPSGPSSPFSSSSSSPGPSARPAASNQRLIIVLCSMATLLICILDQQLQCLICSSVLSNTRGRVK
ncbi:unnamed protein product [Linum trigynum]|uniref:X8 domain-containing protein n=1 Tax=Linum trigynum TaxID=586398 RepID=A0AAV2FBK9_9ROSI